jgi:hypothetical protein
MRALDDILIGFLIFFTIERGIRLLSNAFIEPIALQQTGDKEKAEVWKLLFELALLVTALFLAFKFQKQLKGLNRG